MSEAHNTGVLSQTPDSKQLQVYKLIRDAIVKNEFPPGTVMVERKLCDIYNVSRSPIRNALQQLTFEGLLTYMPGKGTVVPEFNLEDILEVYDLLEVLQVYATRQCIHQLDAVAVETKNMILTSERGALEKEDLYTASQWDQRFHDFIVDRSNNHRLKNLFDQLNNQRVRFITPTLKDTDHYQCTLKEHEDIYRHIVDRDSDAAEAAVRRHYATLKQYYIAMLINKNYLGGTLAK